MGWDYPSVRPASAKDFLDKEVGVALRASALIGKEYYAAVESRQTGEVYGLVMLVDRENGQFGYKAMDEQMGPYYYNCPEKILKLLTPTENKTALKWREQCAKLRETKKAASAIQHGDVIEFDERISFGVYGWEDTFTVCIHMTSNKNKTYRFQMEKNGMLCRITNWKTRPFTILHKATT